MGLIYKITNSKNGKSYIGATVGNFVDRYSGRWWATTHNHELQDDAYKFGAEAFGVEILETDVEVDDLGRLEQEMIFVHNTITPLGYNATTRITKFKKGETPEERRDRLDKLRRNEIRHEFYKAVQTGMPLGMAIKGIRKFLGKTQEQFAEWQHVAINSLRAIEQHDQPDVHLETIRKCLRGSGLQLAVLPEYRCRAFVDPTTEVALSENTVQD